MAKFIPAGFDPDRVRDGLHKAMGFGEPNEIADRATFFFRRRTATTSPADESGVPFNPSVRNVNAVIPSTQVPCVVEFYDAAGQVVSSNSEVRPSRVKLTILDVEWEQVKEFTFVVCSGDKYVRSTHQPVDALGPIDVHTVWAIAEDER